MRKLNSQFATRFISEAGLDGQNGTYFGFVEMDRYYCMAVAEGYDGDGGQKSAKLAVDAAIEAFVQNPGLSAGRIRACLKKAHKCLTEQSVRIRLKAGILLFVSDYTRFRYGVCGNVMLYAFRNAGIYHQSLTHTVYQSLSDAGQLNAEGAGPKEETRNLYHYLGGSGGVTVSGKVKLIDGDVILAVTEGFWSRVNKVEILDAYESIQSQAEFLGDLQELYLRDSTDSIPSCCLASVDVKKTYKENKALKKKIWIWILVLLLLIAVAGAVLTISIRTKQRKQQEVRSAAAVYEENGDQYMTDFECILAKQEYEKAAAEGQKLSQNAERLEMEQLFSEKINISVILDNAGKAYESQDYATARNEYKKALKLIKKYGELAPLINFIDQKLKLVSTGMEIDNYMQSAVLKEAEGDMEAAAILYERVEAMLRIVDRPERLKEVQLALLRVKEQGSREAKEERAKARDEVIIDADKTAAMDAVLAGDFESALELYTKIRDSYIAMEENEKAEETTQIILSLQKQARAAGELAEETIEADKSAALDAVLAGDTERALLLYEKVRDAYLQMEDAERAKEIGTIILSLQKQAAGTSEAYGSQEFNQGSGETMPAKGPGDVSRPLGPGAESGRPDVQNEGRFTLEQTVGTLLEKAIQATADRDFIAAIGYYQKIEILYIDDGDSEAAAQTKATIAGLRKLLEQSQSAEPGGN